MRFFIALEIPENSQLQIKVIQNQLLEIFPNVRLIDHNKLHLTIAFLDDLPENLTPQLTEVIHHAVAEIEPFEVTPAYIDGFPSLHHAHILWMGFKGDLDKLFLIRERIKDSLYTMDIHIDDRRYTPHVAIAKAKPFQMTPDQEEHLQRIAQIPIDPIKVTSIKLFESIPNHGLHKHNTLAEVKLETSSNQNNSL